LDYHANVFFNYFRESLVQVMNQIQTSLSSIVEMEGQCDETMASPGDPGFKRAETFSGFDNKLKPVGVDQAVNRAYSMKTERTGRNYDRQPPGATASPSPETASPVTKHKRRGSGGSVGSGGSGKGWSMRSKSKDDKDTNDLKGNKAITRYATFQFLTPS
jgi:hypothetical protein